ncbi:MAG: hypothetical protein IT200_04355 [Thermoleophilia bacterium]|nr:hypothetical protein [Thermoleophilia bacterium]
MARDPRRRRIREDDPTGGRWLTRRLARWLPVAAVVGALAGVVIALAGGGWGTVPLMAIAAVALAGTVLAALEDGRVQRRIDRMTRRGD